MAKNVSNNQTLEEFRQSYNSLVDEIGGLGTLRTSQKGSMVDAVNSIIDQYFFFQDYRLLFELSNINHMLVIQPQ